MPSRNPETLFYTSLGFNQGCIPQLLVHFPQIVQCNQAKAARQGWIAYPVAQSVLSRRMVGIPHL
jgi:hypothetical protein